MPQAGEVLVKTLSCGICGSDLHALHFLDRMADVSARMGGGGVGGGMDLSKPMVMGHEFSAEILDFGPNCERRLKTGTRDPLDIPRFLNRQNNQ